MNWLPIMSSAIIISNDSDDIENGDIDEIHSNHDIAESDNFSTNDESDNESSASYSLVSQNGTEWELQSESTSHAGWFNAANVIHQAPAFAHQRLRDSPISGAFFMIFSKGMEELFIYF